MGVIAYKSQSATYDWLSRINQPGVVWYHRFDSAAEVNAFRWTNGYVGGNDPLASGTLASACAWVSSGGPDGGGYMLNTRPAGTGDTGQWWRPFSPMTGASNGRGVADPGANGTLTAQTFVATDGGSQLTGWGAGSKPGWYGPTTDSFFDGTDFYFQARVMTDPRRTTIDNPQIGKYVWFNTTENSTPSHEIVTYQAQVIGRRRVIVGAENQPACNAAGEGNFHMMYTNNFNPITGGVSGTEIQLGASVADGTCDPYNSVNTGCWAYATDGTWDTLLYHVNPSGANVQIEVWAAHAGQTSYTKIWDTTITSMSYSTGGLARTGWNAINLGTYANGFQGIPHSEFWIKYAQLIFSKNPIACPQV